MHTQGTDYVCTCLYALLQALYFTRMHVPAAVLLTRPLRQQMHGLIKGMSWSDLRVVPLLSLSLSFSFLFFRQAISKHLLLWPLFRQPHAARAVGGAAIHVWDGWDRGPCQMRAENFVCGLCKAVLEMLCKPYVDILLIKRLGSVRPLIKEDRRGQLGTEMPAWQCARASTRTVLWNYVGPMPSL